MSPTSFRGNNHASRSDTTKRLVKATITPVSKYVKLNAATAARSSQWATVKLTDQYGDPYSTWVQLTGEATGDGTIKVSGGSSPRVGCAWGCDRRSGRTIDEGRGLFHRLSW